MKRILLFSLCLLPLLQSDASPQDSRDSNQRATAEAEREQAVEQLVSDLSQRARLLERENEMLIEEAHRQTENSQTRLMQAIEKELKATLTVGALQEQYENLKQQSLDIEARNAALEKELNDQKSRTQALEFEIQRAANKVSRQEEDLVTSIYVSKYMEGRLLAEVAGQAFGDYISFSSKNPSRAGFVNSSRPRFTSFDSGNQILVTDFPDQMEKALDLLVRIDSSFSKTVAVTPKANPRLVSVYAPRALTAEQIISLLYSDAPASRNDLSVRPIQGSSSVRIEGTSDQIEQAMALLKSTDTFAPQIRLRAWLVSGSAKKTQDSVPLPKELVGGLEKALPGRQFSGLASMLIQSSVGNKQNIRASTTPLHSNDSPTATDWIMSAMMKSYDQEAGLLSLEECSFQVDFSGMTERISADLLLRKNEYTVIGSIQGGSVFLVLSYEDI